LALMGSHEGGGPLVSKSGAGHPSDMAACRARAQAWGAAWQNAPSPRELRADSHLAYEDQALPRHPRGFLTPIPNTMGAVSQVIAPALTWATWPRLADTTRSQGIA
jgi:hypothetical protein